MKAKAGLLLTQGYTVRRGAKVNSDHNGRVGTKNAEGLSSQDEND
jgi:hypothetical protein